VPQLTAFDRSAKPRAKLQMGRLHSSRSGSSANLILVAVVVLALVGSGSVAYACTQAAGGCGETGGDSGGGVCAAADLVWTAPSMVSKPASVLCSLGGLGSSTLTVAVSDVVPGQSCVFDVSLENLADEVLTISQPAASISQPLDCFVYADNVDTAVPMAPGHDFPFVGEIALTGPASANGNACENVHATLEVSITGAEVKTYSVTFSESGLPAGLTWAVTLNGVTEYLKTDGCADSLTWTGLTNGIYGYSIAEIAGWRQSTLAYVGSVEVSGASVAEPTLRYAPVTYLVTFTETGLPAGTLWSATLNGVTAKSTTSSITFSESNGSYGYAIAPVKGYTASPGSGSVSVSGAPVGTSVKFKS
jgi:hypothetical protein